jgi:hypothetical protein
MESCTKEKEIDVWKQLKSLPGEVSSKTSADADVIKLEALHPESILLSKPKIDVPKHLLSRLLYANPVCFLCTNNFERSSRSVSSSSTSTNLMTVSWLTPADNMGTFIMSLKKQDILFLIYFLVAYKIQVVQKTILNLPCQ